MKSELHILIIFLLLTATTALADTQSGGLGSRQNAVIQAAPAQAKPALPAGSAGPAVIHEGGVESFIGQASQLNSGDRAEQMRQLQNQLAMLRQTENALRQKLAQLQAKLAAEEDEAKRRALQAQIDATEAQLRQVENQRAQLEAKIQELARQPAAHEPENKSAPPVRVKKKIKASE